MAIRPLSLAMQALSPDTKSLKRMASKLQAHREPEGIRERPRGGQRPKAAKVLYKSRQNAKQSRACDSATTWRSNGHSAPMPTRAPTGIASKNERGMRTQNPRQHRPSASGFKNASSPLALTVLRQPKYDAVDDWKSEANLKGCKALTLSA